MKRAASTPPLSTFDEALGAPPAAAGSRCSSGRSRSGGARAARAAALAARWLLEERAA